VVKARAPKSADEQASQPTLDGATLRLGERIVPLRSGAMHYWRVRPESWRECLRQVRALHLPMVETYVPWSVHEVEKGKYDFGETDPRKDLPRFLEIAEEEDLVVFLRPGPHVNAELTYFGIPERVIHDRDCQARSPRGNPVVLYFPPRMFPVPSHASEAYHEELGAWYDAVADVVGPKVWPEGPVVLLQVDNEVGYFFRNGPFCQDYHDDAIALWHTFLEKRHGNLRNVATAHGAAYPSWNEVLPPTSFRGDRQRPGDLVRQLDWAAFQEHLLSHAIHRMKRRMRKAGLRTPVVHNVSLGDAGLPVSVPSLNREVDLVGFDYYHPAREHRTIKRRTSYLAGTLDVPYAPELGVGSFPWFTPLSHGDSLYCAMAACAYGLRGFNLYMTVDRDRWYGAAIDATGHPRAEAATWRRFMSALSATGFHELKREAKVALVMPREYQRLARATHLLGPVSGSALEAIGGTPVDACRGDDLGFSSPVQLEWWRLLARIADALTTAGVPNVYVDSEAPVRMLEGFRVVFAPAFEWADPDRWHKLHRVASRGAHVVYGPLRPTLDTNLRPVELEAPRDEAPTEVPDESTAHALVHDWITRFELARPYSTMRPLETALHRDGERDAVLFVMNPSERALGASVALPRPTLARDLLSDETFVGDSELKLKMPPRTVRMLSLEEPPSAPPPRARASGDGA